MSFTAYSDRGLTGLSNLGNTCFMNSALHCLSHSYEFNEFLKKAGYKAKLNKIPDSLVLMEWDKLRELIWSENCIISPGGFFSSIQKVAKVKNKPIFTGYAQNDLPEFLIFIIDCFHNAILREVHMVIKGQPVTDTDKLATNCFNMMRNMYKKEYSEILEFFYGIHVSRVCTVGGDYISSRPEPFLTLDLAIPNLKNPSLEDCIAEYTAKESLEEGNEVFNEKSGKKERVERQILFWSLPHILIITLKRFSNDVRKNKHLVDFPLEDLDLSPYVVGYDKHDYVYDLYGVCCHSGGCLGGHYTAFIKNANGSWYHFDDTRVSAVKDTSSLKNQRAYCFFYRKKNKDGTI